MLKSYGGGDRFLTEAIMFAETKLKAKGFGPSLFLLELKLINF